MMFFVWHEMTLTQSKRNIYDRILTSDCQKRKLFQTSVGFVQNKESVHVIHLLFADIIVASMKRLSEYPKYNSWKACMKLSYATIWFHEWNCMESNVRLGLVLF